MVEFNKKTRLPNFIKGFVGLALFFIFTYFKTVPLLLLHIDYDNLSIVAKEVYSLSAEILLFGIIFIMFEDEFKKAWRDLKENHMKYFSKNFKYYLLGLLIMMGSNMLINLLGGDLSQNETSIRQQFQIAPIFTFVSGVFLAPALEESIFRLSLRNMIENNFIFVIISGLIFGSLHLLAGVNMNLVFLYLVSYSCFGIVFAYMIVKTNNIFIPMGFHLMHNGVLMSMQMLLFLLN